MTSRRYLCAILVLSLMLFQLVPLTPARADSEQAEAPQLNWSGLYGAPKDRDFHSNNYAYGNGIYIAAEGYSSKDGIHWTNIPALDHVRLQFVAWGKGRFVGLTYKEKNQIAVWTSTDGQHWTETAAKLPAQYFLGGLTSNGSRFIAVGSGGPGTYYTSTDGVKWTQRSSGLNMPFTDIAWGNGTFVALGSEGRVAVSKDGQTWKKVSVPIKDYYGMQDIAYAGGSFVALGDYFLISSKDGIKWSSVPSEGIYYNRVVWVKDRFFAEGFKYADERKKQETSAVLKTSKDGKKWTDLSGYGSLTATHYGSMHDINMLYDGKQYVNYFDHGVYASKDGVKWTLLKKTPLKPYRLTRSAVGNGRLVAVGGTIDGFDPEVEKLADRGAWRIDSSGKVQYSLELGKFPLFDVIWTGTRFFAVGFQGLMMASADGIKWEKTASPTKESLYRIIEANGTYYTVGNNGTILSSKDLKSWKKHKVPVSSHLNSIAWDGHTFAAVGENGAGVVSADGTTWTKMTGLSKHDYTDITWGNGSFVIVSPVGTSTMYKSKDGRKWSSVNVSSGIRASGQTTGLINVCYTGDLFVALGREGTVLLSADAIHWQRQDMPQDSLLENAQAFNGKLYVFGYDSEVYFADLP